MTQNSIETHQNLTENDLQNLTLSQKLDLAEAKLMEHIRKGNLRAIIFYLENKGQARGYGKSSPDPEEPSDYELRSIKKF